MTVDQEWAVFGYWYDVTRQTVILETFDTQEKAEKELSVYEHKNRHNTVWDGFFVDTI